ncbi:hypothetical protein GCM10028814_20560 [Angustibacter aerolatus]
MHDHRGEPDGAAAPAPPKLWTKRAGRPQAEDDRPAPTDPPVGQSVPDVERRSVRTPSSSAARRARAWSIRN